MSYEFHPLANIFPLIEGQAFADLVEDVRANGVREPIWMYQHQILDGRNRYRAANEAGIKCELRTYEGNNAVGFVISLNLHRRHLTESQRGMVASKLANMEQGQRTDLQPSANLPKVSQSDAAKLLNVSTRTVTAATKVQDEGAPDLVAAVERGDVSVSAAAAVASLPKDQQESIAKGGKKEIQRAAKEARSKPQDAVTPVGTEHVLYVINQMDLIARYLSRNSMTVDGLADRFLSEVDADNQVVGERLDVAIPIMKAIGRIGAELAAEQEAI